MKKTMKRFLLLLTMAALLVGMFAGMASAAPIANAPISSADSKMPFSIHHVRSGSNVTLTYTVSLQIGEEIAEYASVTRQIRNNGDLKMKRIRFVCYLEDALIKELDVIPEIQQNDIFEKLDTIMTEKGVKIVFKVKDSVCEQWDNMDVEAVKNQLMQSRMFVTGTGTTTIANLNAKCYASANGSYYIDSYGRLMILFVDNNEDLLASTKGMDYDTIRLNERDERLFQIDTSSTAADIQANENLLDSIPGTATGSYGESAFVPGVGFWVDGPIPATGFNGYWVEGNRPEQTNETYRLTPVPAMLNDAEHFTYIFGYDDGDVRPGKSITRAEVATIFYRLLKDNVRSQYFSTSNTFSDVTANHWFNITVSTMANAGIVNGYPDGTFRPNAPITRAEFATIIARFDGGITTGAVTFPDVYGHWAKSYVDRAAELGWINGYTDGTFRPNQNITRAETAAMINRVLNRAPQSTADLLSNMKVWPDNTNVSAWYYLDMQEATNSHTYERKNNGFETWKQIVPNKTWTE